MIEDASDPDNSWRAAWREGDSWRAKLFRQKDTILGPFLFPLWYEILTKMNKNDYTAYVDHCKYLREYLRVGLVDCPDDITEDQYYTSVEHLQQMRTLMNLYVNL